ncbi:hypothetical protein CLRAG_23960 [Clostridium ragsdalei P11]|uniref:Uncharacterized protein n=1 Tax=Clostridium ragsdalei P11 TaxID=1353534 RepID=A0A1A6ARN3_9CLOT|nr:hypothetical protein [Clostridium ragsdalei]OBR92690.1 hypothetical protein CLRAG_23960 [Clostridium ragsdalei P11]
MLFFSSFSITAIIIVALSNKNSDIKIENKITLRPDKISSDTKVSINNSKKIIDILAILFKDMPEDTPILTQYLLRK